MRQLRVIVSVLILGVWVIGYLLAYFVDPMIGDLAKSSTPLAGVALSFLLGTEALKVIRGGTPS